MARAIDNRAVTVGSLFLLCAFAACNKRDEPAPAASVSTGASQVAAASAAIAQAGSRCERSLPPLQRQPRARRAAAPSASAAAPTPVLGEVKRFSDKETAASGATKVALADSKVFDEPDVTKPSVASLPKDLLVTRMAALGSDWVLVEFPPASAASRRGGWKPSHWSAEPAPARSRRPARALRRARSPP